MCDLNGDGKLDLVVANMSSDTVSVLLNTTAPGAATLSFATKEDFATSLDPMTVTVGDLNGDGKLDLAVANFQSDTVSVLLNTTAPAAATPSFAAKQDFATPSFPSPVTMGDLNGDGKLDLVVGGSDNVPHTSGLVSVLLNTTAPGAATPSFATREDFPTGFGPRSITVGDLNGDGKLDLAVANVDSANVSVLLNTTAPGAATPSFAAKEDFAPGTHPISVTVGDLNGDGKLDLVVANAGSANVSVLLNTTAPGAATPSFAAKQDFASGTAPDFVTVGDLNGDGKLDLVVANGLSTVSVLLNTTAQCGAAPGFTPKEDFATGSTPSSGTVGDLNGDGKLDLAVANFNSDNVSVLLNTTAPGAVTPSFAAKEDFATGTSPISVTLGDLNRDGKLDLVVANQGPDNVSVLLNTTAPGAATPSFAAKEDFATGFGPQSVTVGELNGDSNLDLVVANYGSHTVSVLLNTTAPGAATPSFAAKEDFATGSNPSSVTGADLNGDGKLDLMVANQGSHTVSVLLNTTAPGAAAPSFAAKEDFATGFFPQSVTVGELNGDGKLDLVVANYNSDTVSVLLNTTAPGAATPSFAAKEDFATGSNPSSVTVGDLNGDGKLDLVVANSGSDNVSVLLNTTAPGAATPSFAAKEDFATGVGPFSITVGELNGDGKLDLVVANAGSDNISVLLTNTATATSDPVDVTVCQGATAGFSTTASGTGPFSYAWTVDGVPFGGDSPSIDVPTGDLSLGNHTVEVTVTGSCGSATQTATLTVQETTSATTPGDQTVCQGLWRTLPRPSVAPVRLPINGRWMGTPSTAPPTAV